MFSGFLIRCILLVFSEDQVFLYNFYEPICITTMLLCLRRSVQLQQFLSSLAMFTTVFNHSLDVLFF